MSSRDAPIASALDGLSCTIPRLLSGTPVAPDSWHASALSSDMNGSGLLPDSWPTLGCGSPSEPVSARMRDSWCSVFFSMMASNCSSVSPVM